MPKILCTAKFIFDSAEQTLEETKEYLKDCPAEALEWMGDDAKALAAKAGQDYDHSPPRCVTRVYWRYGPQEKYIERQVKGRSGKIRQQLQNAYRGAGAGKRTNAAQQQRAARKRRNLRARSSKRA